MIEVKQLTYNPFQENTFVLTDDSDECVIIDPGCYEEHERANIKSIITDAGVIPTLLLNTHCHIDHVLGNKFIKDTYSIPLWIHEKDLMLLDNLEMVANMYGIPNVQTSPKPDHYMNHGDQIKFGNSVLDVVFVPGHAPGPVAFISHEDKFVIGGDCLFMQSIGRTDLPGGNHQELLDSIRREFFTLPDDYKVYCGHGQPTSIGYEKENNPFLT